MQSNEIVCFFFRHFLTTISTLVAQIGINVDGEFADPSSGLDVNFTDKGVLLPRLTSNQVIMIDNPAIGLVVFNTDSLDLYIFTGINWVPVGNGAGTTSLNPFSCGSVLTVTHKSGHIAPVNKTISYGTVTNIPGETSKCWISNNLGSEHQAVTKDDNTEAAAGWYWQFNRKQGYMHDGLTRLPGTDWIDAITEVLNWLPENDPCALELGNDWRIPTNSEWTNVKTAGNWNSWTSTFSSALKLHAAGGLSESNGNLIDRGSVGAYWSSVRSSPTNAINLYFNNSTCGMINNSKTYGFPLRCINCVNPAAPGEGDHLPSASQVVWDWDSIPGASGYKWNTDDDFSTAADMDTLTTKTETGLCACSDYTRYVWSYNACGHSTPVKLSQKTLSCPCGNSITVNHVAGTLAPITKTITYGTVTNIPGEPAKCWTTKNLGADRQPSLVNDTSEAAAGWYWQFNRLQGYKHDGTTRTPATTWISSISENSGWSYTHDPCQVELGSTWRIPTASEWTNVDAAGAWEFWTPAFYSLLKLHGAGRLVYSNGNLNNRGNIGYYWSTWGVTGVFNLGQSLFISPILSLVQDEEKATGMSVRCINCMNFTPDSATNEAMLTQITWNWKPVTNATGYKWNTTNDYASAEDLETSLTKTELYLFTETSYTRYVWSYNDCGYSSPLSLTGTTLAFTCTDSLTILHTQGDVAPITKAVSYGTITNIPGETSKCWITSNLGSDNQANSANDPSEESAGWYWQYGEKQGFKHDGIAYIPDITWLFSIIKSSDWLPSEDPCTIELGAEWRVPTQTEWTNIDLTGGWSSRNDAWNSDLKIHAAGYLFNGDGTLMSRGSKGYYWSNTYHTNGVGWSLFIDETFSFIANTSYSYAHTLRCIRE